MIIDDTKYETTLKYLLQKDIKFNLNGKSYKKGKLILFKQRNYHLELTLQKNNNTKKIEIPIPYNIEMWADDNLVYFDYRLTTLSKGDKELYNLITKMVQQSYSKFYDSILELEIL